MTTLLDATSYYDGYPLVVHHTMVVPILREFAQRTNRDQYRMLSWNGVQIEGAEDFNHGVQWPEPPLPRVDWELLHKSGELQQLVTKHPNNKFLKVARMFFNYTPEPEDRDLWIETPDHYRTDTLDVFTPDAISFDTLILHIEPEGEPGDEHDEQPLPPFFAMVNALRRMQNVLKSPVYHYVEIEDGGAPKMLKDAFAGLEPESADRLTTGEDHDLFESAVNLDLVADFLIAKRAFKAFKLSKAFKVLEISSASNIASVEVIEDIEDIEDIEVIEVIEVIEDIEGVEGVEGVEGGKGLRDAGGIKSVDGSKANNKRSIEF